MDAAVDGFIRDQALRKWEEVRGLREDVNLSLKESIKAASVFPEKENYHKIWSRWWEQILDTPLESDNNLFAKIESAVRGAVMEEREERKRAQDNLLEDCPDYKAFVARQFNHLFCQTDGEIEEFEDEL
ncbi:MAG: hypothetical protein GY786_05155 [Proteobacteria bacterium]|nr:hypothetical protein [Pseudomonadota bacterium]